MFLAPKDGILVPSLLARYTWTGNCLSSLFTMTIIKLSSLYTMTIINSFKLVNNVFIMTFFQVMLPSRKLLSFTTATKWLVHLCILKVCLNDDEEREQGWSLIQPIWIFLKRNKGKSPRDHLEQYLTRLNPSCIFWTI